MAYQFEPRERVDRELRRIATELIDHAIGQVEDREVARHEAVHEVRKDCKRLRGLLRLVRPAAARLYRRENQWLRDAAAPLSGVRDATAAIECYDKLMVRFGAGGDSANRMAPVRQALIAERDRRARDAGDLDAGLSAFREAMRAARARVPEWQLPPADPSGQGFDLLGPGLKKTYQRGRRAMDAAYHDPSVAHFHEWRKRVKYLRYQLRLLRRVWPALMKPLRDEVKALGDLLGDDHDLAVLEDSLERALGEGDTARELRLAMQELLKRRSGELRHQARRLGLRVYAERPKALRRRIGAYWGAAQNESG